MRLGAAPLALARIGREAPGRVGVDDAIRAGSIRRRPGGHGGAVSPLASSRPGAIPGPSPQGSTPRARRRDRADRQTDRAVDAGEVGIGETHFLQAVAPPSMRALRAERTDIEALR